MNSPRRRIVAITVAVVVGRLRRIVEQAGADDVVGRLDRGEPQAEPV